VSVGVKPVQSGIVIVRDRNAILKRLAWAHVQEDIVSVPAQRNVQAVKMENRRLLQLLWSATVSMSPALSRHTGGTYASLYSMPSNR